VQAEKPGAQPEQVADEQRRPSGLAEPALTRHKIPGDQRKDDQRPPIQPMRQHKIEARHNRFPCTTDPWAPADPLRPSGRRGRGPSRSDGRVRWVPVSALESPTSPQPSPPPRAEREPLVRFAILWE